MKKLLVRVLVLAAFVGLIAGVYYALPLGLKKFDLVPYKYWPFVATITPTPTPTPIPTPTPTPLPTPTPVIDDSINQVEIAIESIAPNLVDVLGLTMFRFEDGDNLWVIVIGVLGTGAEPIWFEVDTQIQLSLRASAPEDTDDFGIMYAYQDFTGEWLVYFTVVCDGFSFTTYDYGDTALTCAVNDQLYQIKPEFLNLIDN